MASRKTGGRRGIALIATLLVMLILMVMGAGFVFFTVNDMHISANVVDSAIAMNLAEAGIDYAIWLLKHNMTIYPGTDPNGADQYKSGYRVFNAAAYGYNTADYPNGSIVNLNVNPLSTTSAALEHVVISNLSYGGSNFLSEGNHCGTFEMHIVSITDGGSGTNAYKDILFESIGRVRQVPSIYGDSPDWTRMKETSPANAVWTVKAQRTIFTVVRLYTSPAHALTEGFTIKKFYEKFR